MNESTRFTAPCTCYLLYTPLDDGRSLCTHQRCPDHPAPADNTVRTVAALPDSVEVDTPSKGGALKVYFDAADPAAAKRKVDNALEVRAYLLAQGKKEAT